MAAEPAAVGSVPAASVPFLSLYYSKIFRVLTALAVLAGARLLVFLLFRLSRFLIYCDWGPLRLVYPNNKNRQLTLNAIGLNIFKYIIYFASFGYILSELGFDYKAYLASLSVIGLAVGFGSQGLVQDVVTGFFIILEGQFDVGDMVEISGQTGIIEDLGLRMTRLRNYAGQTVCIPNRVIGVVGTYRKGAMDAFMDIPLSRTEDFSKAVRIIEVTGGFALSQFPEVLLSPPRALEKLQSDGGPGFVRIHVRIWPGQQWLIDQELLPRLKSAFETADIPIRDNRITVFYHVPDEQSVISRSRKNRKKEAKKQ